MPLYMDTHHKVEGLTSEAVTAAHQKDLEVQNKYGVKYLRYWYDEGTGKVFCLCEAPSKEAAEAVHREAHGGVADEITEVREARKSESSHRELASLKLASSFGSGKQFSCCLASPS